MKTPKKLPFKLKSKDASEAPPDADGAATATTAPEASKPSFLDGGFWKKRLNRGGNTEPPQGEGLFGKWKSPVQTQSEETSMEVSVAEEQSERLELLDLPFLSREDKRRRERDLAVTAPEAEFRERGYVRRHASNLEAIRQAVDEIPPVEEPAPEPPAAAPEPEPLPEAEASAPGPEPEPVSVPVQEPIPEPPAPEVTDEVREAVARAVGTPPASVTLVYATGKSHVVEVEYERDGESTRGIFIVVNGEARDLETVRERTDALEPKAKPAPAPEPPSASPAVTPEPAPEPEAEAPQEKKGKKLGMPFGKKSGKTEATPPEDAAEAQESPGSETAGAGKRKRKLGMPFKRKRGKDE